MTLWLLFVFAAAAWGGSFLFMRLAAPHFHPMVLVGLRLGLGALILSPLVWPQRRSLRPHLFLLAALGFFNAALPFTFFAWALRSLPAGHGAILNSTTPLFTALLGSLYFGQPQSPRVWLGIALWLAGVTLCAEPWQAGASVALLPSLACLGATLSYALAAHLAKRLPDVPPLALAWSNLAFGVAWVLLPSLFLRPAGPVPASAWWAATGLGLISTGLAFWAFYIFFKAWGPLRATAVAYFIPFFGMGLGYVVLGEPIRQGWLPGLALVLLGMVLAKKTVSKIEEGL